MKERVSWGVAVVLLLTFITPGAFVAAVEYGGLGGIPANPDPNNPRTKSIFVYTLTSGQSKQDGVNIVNNTAETKTVEVYATDSEIASGGSFACRQKVDAKNEVGQWIKLNQAEVQLAPQTNEIVSFEVVIPDNPGVGEHNGCIVIQEKGGATQDNGNGVQLSFRSAIRVAITVPGDIIKNIEFDDLRVKPESKKYIITSQLNNTGNVSLDTDVEVRVQDLFGREVYKNGGVYPLLAQKNAVELNFEFPRPFWGGIYKFRGTADYNNDPSTTLGDAAPKNVQKASPTRLLLVWPQPLALLLEMLVLLFVLLLFWLLVKYWRRSKKVAKSWETYTVRKGDTLIKLAANRQVKWKTIARVNKLRAPYELQKGMALKLPTKRNNE